MASFPKRFKNGPSKPCSECGAPLILKSGTSRVAHFAHLPAANSSSREGCTGGGGESETHAAAKDAIVSHLKGGGSIEAIVKCVRCRATTKRQIGPFQFEDAEHRDRCVVKEHVIDHESMARADVAVLLNGEINVLIEVRYKHVTSEHTARNQFSWYEFDASCVLWYETQQPHSIWMLRDMRESRLTLDDGTHQQCISNKDLAFTIGSYRRNFSHPLLKALCIASKGWYWKYQHVWELPDNDCITRATNENIRKRCQCLRCGGTALNVSAYKPYCMRCYKKTASEMNSDEQYTNRVKVVVTSKPPSTRFHWLAGVPVWVQGASCTVCLKDDCAGTYGSYVLYGSYVWFYGKRNICELCFVTRQEIVDDALLAFAVQ